MREEASKMRSRGFTLIELLVVIAIIAILAAILFPVFARAKESARQATCLKHGGQLGVALSIYTDEHSGRFPLCWVFRPNASTLTWAHALAPYAKSLGVFSCPSVPKRQFTGSTVADSHGDADRITGGFGYNTAEGGGGKANGVARGRNSDMYNPDPYSQSDLAAPSKHIAFGDSRTNDEQGIYPGYNFCDVIKALTGGKYHVKPSFRHSGGATFIFCDGHAKWLNEAYFGDWKNNSHHWFVDNRNR